MSKKTKSFIANLLLIVVCVGLAYGLANYLFTNVPVDGYSMQDTLQHEDRVLLFKPGKYKYGDIVVFKCQYPDEEKKVVKRIIGLPGDTIEIISDPDTGRAYVYRNGERLEEEYLTESRAAMAELPRRTIGEGAFFFLGDNRANSRDCREAGIIGELSKIEGRVVLRYHIDKNQFLIKPVKRVS